MSLFDVVYVGFLLFLLALLIGFVVRRHREMKS